MERYQDESWRRSMRLRVDYNNMMSDQLGKRGLYRREIETMQQQIDTSIANMRLKRPIMRWRELPYNQDEVINSILETAAGIREQFDDFVVLGIGGSALGPIAVQQALNHLHYNDLPREKRNGPRLFVEDNIDPERMAALLDVIDVEKTAFNVVSKSGGTSETMSQLLIISSLLHEKLGKDISTHLFATTDESKGSLIKIARAENLKTFFIPEGVGGRFSELCPVGLLAAAVCGIDIREMLAGAAYMDEICDSQRDVWKNPAYMLATLQVASIQRGCNISVMMPYADSLRYMADWYAQLWAESLGKRVDWDGNVVNAGQTPVKSLGVTDQHSQVQLYTEGPFDKVITFLAVDRYRCETMISDGYFDVPDVSFLCGHTQNELIAAELKATEYAVSKSGHLNHTILLPEVNAFTVGQLLFLFELATAFAGELLNINAFDQPGVEEGKKATYALLGKASYDEKREELAAIAEKNERYII
ncbi:MAG TPA: glucose-6-phosphate isomerase [Clostridia bacterium]|nr:glucose-6-phosphate isomerase [Clostridia bacterium]